MSEQTAAEVVKVAISVGAYREGTVFPTGERLLRSARELVRLALANEPWWKGREIFNGKPNPCPKILAAYRLGLERDRRSQARATELVPSRYEELLERVDVLEKVVRRHLVGELAVAMSKLLGR